MYIFKKIKEGVNNKMLLYIKTCSYEEKPIRNTE